MANLCGCGCGTPIGEKARYALGHHWVVKRRARDMDVKRCEECGRFYSRASIGNQSDAHWRARRFCTEECRRAALSWERDGLFRCHWCKEFKPRDAFFALKSGKHGINPGCKACRKARRKPKTSEQHFEHNLKWLYGLTGADYMAMHGAQAGLCKICRRPESTVNYRNGETYRLAVDHCHETGAIRGLLCSNCNKSIGGLKHDPALLRAALEYLEG